MFTLSTFERRLIHDGKHRDVKLDSGRVNWLAAQEHVGENVGGRRRRVACSYAYARRSSVGSLHAAPMKDMPTGSPCT